MDLKRPCKQDDVLNPRASRPGGRSHIIGVASSVLDSEELPREVSTIKPTTILAFDFGLSRIGVATGQSVTRTATALTTVRARRGEPAWTDIDALVREWRPDLLIVGLPLNMDSTESEMSERASAFADVLRQRYSIAVNLVDERLTSFEARGLSAVEDERHAIAARLIAETFLSGGT